MKATLILTILVVDILCLSLAFLTFIEREAGNAIFFIALAFFTNIALIRKYRELQ
jgi:hypothetical protein